MNLEELKSVNGTPTFELKPLSKEAIASATAKAEHYRLLNQPSLAESICLDILEVDQGNEKVQIILILALTDQFGEKQQKARNAIDLANGLGDTYSKLYYLGIIHERQGSSSIRSSSPGTNFDAYEWFLEAMDYYEQADELNPAGNEDVVLRWNTCARIIMEHHLQRRPLDERSMLE